MLEPAMLYRSRVRTKYLSVIAALFIGFLAGCHRDDQIKSYSVSNDKAAPAPAKAAPAMSMNDPNAQAVPVNAAPIKWTTPAAWQELAPNMVRIGNFVVPGPGTKHAEVTILSFPGDVGGELANVNRWRGEVGFLSDITEAQITSQPATVDGSTGKLYDIVGPAGRTIVAVILRDGASWFIKLRGDNDVVASAQSTFNEFLKSIRFGGPGKTQMVSAPMTVPTSAAPAVMEAAPIPSTAKLPNMAAPANWSETPAGNMVVRSFSISGEAGQKAAVSISVFGGTTGGTLANVNRWRGQLSLPPIADADLAANTKNFDVLGGQATVVDFTGNDISGQPVRLVAAIVARGQDSWFYKLTGDNSLVEREKPAFVKFVQTVQY
jgi:hypothetical protein